VPEEFIPPAVDVHLKEGVEGSMQAHATLGSDEAIFVPSRFLQPRWIFWIRRSSLRDTDAAISHEYGHILFKHAMLLRASARVKAVFERTAALSDRLDAYFDLVATLKAAPKTAQGRLRETQQRLPGVAAAYRAAVEGMVKEFGDSWQLSEAALSSEAGRRWAEAERAAQSLIDEVDAAQRKTDPDLLALQLDVALERIKFDLLYMPYFSGLTTPYHELFGDVVGLVRSGELDAIAELLPSTTGRSFEPGLAPDGWWRSESHDLFGPTRSYIGEHIVPKFFASPEQQKEMFEKLVAVFDADLAATMADFPAPDRYPWSIGKRTSVKDATRGLELPLGNPEQRNRKLIERLRKAFE
jgi:hypothetical protein